MANAVRLVTNLIYVDLENGGACLLFSSVAATPIDSSLVLKALVASSAARIPLAGRTILMAMARSSFLACHDSSFSNLVGSLQSPDPSGSGAIHKECVRLMGESGLLIEYLTKASF